MLTRRQFLHSAAAAGALSLAPELLLASAPGERRLVVMVLRGAVDGLDVVQPYGDRQLAKLRPGLARTPDNGLIDLDGFFGLHDSLADLYPLYRDGELGFVHAVSSPYRNRSHFQGQDVLETGTTGSGGAQGGWLNRAIGFIPGAHGEFAYDISRGGQMLLAGRQRVASWLPETDLDLAGDSESFLRILYENDQLMLNALEGAIGAEMADNDEALGPRRIRPEALARLAGEMLNGEARIAAFSIGGWDTHLAQDKRIGRPLKDLASAILVLKETLGPNWAETACIGITEFGRTARQNGTGGTDHGTGTIMIHAGGAMAGGGGGKVLHAGWPGLADSDLYEGRDLMPTDDVRRYAGWILAALYGLDRGDIEGTVFPGLDLGSDPGLI